MTDDLANRFMFHPPKNAAQGQKYEMVRSIAHSVAVAVSDMTVPSRELSLAITKLEEFMFWANAAIARNEDATPQG